MLGFLAALLVFAILVFVHELGHFLLAKWAGVGVLEFAIGFGPNIIQRRVGETMYSLRAIPLGGYVRMVGEDPTNSEIPEGTPIEELRLYQDSSKWLSKKGYWKKFWVVFAGPLFNMIFAFVASVFLIGVYGMYESVDKPIIGATIPKQPAEAAGLKGGDQVLKINGVEVESWEKLALTVRDSGGAELNLTVKRGEQELPISVKPVMDEGELAYLEGVKAYRIGIVPDLKRKSVMWYEAVPYGAMSLYATTLMTAKGMWGMLTGHISTDNLAGPVFIFGEAADKAKKGLEYILDFMIMLSVGLALLNLLPIPILDGGHIVFFTIEALIGRPVSIALRERAMQIGMVFLLLLTFYALKNDLTRERPAAPQVEPAK